MTLDLLSSAYSTAARWRRLVYDRDPARRRRLDRPVISVGNLRVGGSGKTPVVGHIARLLLDRGHRPAILTRGYGRVRPSDGVTVVSDGTRVLGDVAVSGDEPLMLARRLPGAIVLAGANRYVSGRFAERQLGATIHLLDDGFQHFPLARDVDLLMIEESDLRDRPLPSGRLREGLEAAVSADAVLVSVGYASAAERVGRMVGVSTAFLVNRTIGAPRLIASGDPVVVPSEARVFGVAGIARPDRFFSDLTAAGWTIVGSIAFRDHHPYTARDVRRIGAAARAASAAIVLTTDKDAVRFAACDLGDLPIAAVPLHTSVEPAAAFAAWLMGRVTSAPAARGQASS